jgi:dihydropyrimidinase
MTDSLKLITGGNLVSSTGIVRADLLIAGERISAVGEPGSFAGAQGAEILDASGAFVLPGLIDPHLHFNSPFMGTVTVHDFLKGSAAAAFGGITTIIDFSTQAKGASILENMDRKAEEAKASCIDWSVSGILLDAGPETLEELPRLVAAGYPTYKCFTTYKHSGRLMDDASMLTLLEATAACGGMLMVHCENDPIIERRLRAELEAGHRAPIYHARSRPASAEVVAIRRVIDLMREVPAPVYIVHVSTAEGLALIEQAKREGLPIHCETCTHYLTLTERQLEGPQGQLFICSPPLREDKDIEGLWRGVSSGSVEVISSDDAGVSPADNYRIGAGGFDKVPSGISGIEPRLAILYSEGVVRRKMGLPKLVELAALNPARLFGMYPQKGILAPGSDADVLIYDPSPEWTMTAKELHMNTDFCAFDGWKIKGRVRSVLSRGGFVIRDGDLVGKPGTGRRVFRRLSL